MGSTWPAFRVAVVGAGSIGREFATQHFGPATGTRVACIIDSDAERAQALARDVGSLQAGANVVGSIGYRATADRQRGTPVPHYTSLGEEALESCDCVYIGTTPASHADLVRRALSAGRHVILEKPIASSGADADFIVEAAETALSESGLRTSMNIGMRWNAALIRMREELANGRIGSPEEGWLRLHFRTWPREWQQQQWVAERAQGGPLREVGTHFLFGLHELFGHGCVSRVQAMVQYPDGPDGKKAEEVVTGVLELAGGIFGAAAPTRIHLSVNTSASTRRDVYELEVRGTKGALKLFDFTSLADNRGKALVSNAPYGRQECVQGLVEATRAKSPATAERIAAGLVSAREARNAQRVLDALLLSDGEWLEVMYD